MKRPVPAKAQTGFLLPKNKGSKNGGKPGHVLLAHGAGGHKDHPHMLDLAATMNRAGLTTHRFNFPYRAEGRSFPDRIPVLTECFRDNAQRILRKEKPGFLILAGHSMATRAALALAAEGFPCRGLILFSYPLHPPGHPEKLRLDHLDALRVPVLSLSGTNDTFCTQSLMDETVKGVAMNGMAVKNVSADKTGRDTGRRSAQPAGRRWTHHWIEGADHGLKVAKKSGRTRTDVLSEIEAICRGWLASLPQA